jgi:hypothetical protein
MALISAKASADTFPAGVVLTPPGFDDTLLLTANTLYLGPLGLEKSAKLANAAFMRSDATAGNIRIGIYRVSGSTATLIATTPADGTTTLDSPLFGALTAESGETLTRRNAEVLLVGLVASTGITVHTVNPTGVDQGVQGIPPFWNRYFIEGAEFKGGSIAAGGANPPASVDLTAISLAATLPSILVETA